jgi:hypothetical protein
MPDKPEVPTVGGMRGEGRLTAGGIVSGSAILRGEGTLVAGGTIRDAVQELRDSSREELQRLLNLYIMDAAVLCCRHDAPVATAETVAEQAEVTGKPSLAKLIRAGAKFGIMTILAAIISGPVNYEESDLLHWTPPSITQVQQMSPVQMDELARLIEKQLEQIAARQEAEHEQHHEHGDPRRGGPSGCASAKLYE